MLPSEQQLQLLDWISRAHGLAAAELTELALQLREFLVTKPKDEDLDLRWESYWGAHRSRFQQLPLGLAKPLVIMLDSALKKNSSVRPRQPRTPLRRDERVAVLLGAGASAPPPSSIPTVNRLLPELWERAKSRRRPDLDKLAAWCNDAGLTSIEDLLTAAHIADFCVTNSHVTRLLGYFFSPPHQVTSRNVHPVSAFKADASVVLLQEALKTLFLLLTSTMLPSPPNAAHEAIVRLLQSHACTSIITTNYDGCMDEAILKARVATGMGPALRASDDGKPELIKVHGSVNWTYCEACQDVREFELLKLKRDVAEDTYSFAVTGLCPKCKGPRQPLLVPPLSFKSLMFPTLIGLWNTARIRIEQASVFLVVGYAFSEADTYISKVIARSLGVNPAQRMVVVDTNKDLVPSLQRRFAATIDNFNPERIIEVRGDCAQVLPQVVDELVGSGRW